MHYQTYPADTGRKLNVHKTFNLRQDVFWTSYVRSIYVLCLRGNFNERISADTSVSECLWRSILETSSNLSKILAVMRHYKKISTMTHFFKKLWKFTSKQSKFEVHPIEAKLVSNWEQNYCYILKLANFM